MSTSSKPAERFERRGERRDPAGRESFSRRIECDGDSAPMRAEPARGGGLREPDDWARRREARS